MCRGKKGVQGKKAQEKQHGPEPVPSSQVQLPSREGLGLFWPVQSLVMLTAQGEPKLATCPFLRTLWVLCAQCPGGALGTPPTPTIPHLILLHRWAS